MANYYINNGQLVSEDILYHYGIKGMRWGHRKKPEYSAIAKNVQSTKATYKDAKKAYNKAYNSAYNYSARHPIGQWVNEKKRAESDARWDNTINKAKTLNSAKAEYKSAKKARKDAVKSTYRDLNKKATIGEKLVYSEGTRKKAAKYIVDNNMSVAEATKKAKGDAWRNTALFVAGYGAVAAATLYANR